MASRLSLAGIVPYPPARNLGHAQTLYDKPEIDYAKARVSGPLTIETIPVPATQDVDVAQRSLSNVAALQERKLFKKMPRRNWKNRRVRGRTLRYIGPKVQSSTPLPTTSPR